MSEGAWRTISGRRVFIKNGQSLTEAMRDSGKFNSLNYRLKKQFNEAKIKQALENYTNGKYRDYCEYAQYLVGGEGKVSKEFFETSMFPEISDEVKDITKQIMEKIDEQPPYTDKLWRVERGFREDIDVGDELNYGLISTTRDKALFDRIAEGIDEGIEGSKQMTLFEFEGNHQALDIAKYSPYDQSESLLKGNYRVSRVEYNLKPEIKTYSVRELASNFPDKYEVFISKKGNEVVRFKDSGMVKPINTSTSVRYTSLGVHEDDAKWQMSDFVERRTIYLEKIK